eukprot:1154317-Pelagomonas_calceolata.AAC.4
MAHAHGAGLYCVHICNGEYKVSSFLPMRHTLHKRDTKSNASCSVETVLKSLWKAALPPFLREHALFHPHVLVHEQMLLAIVLTVDRKGT